MALKGLDDIDSRILTELQKNGRVPNIELADTVGLSPSQCLRRLRRIEGLGIVRGYTTLLSTEALGLGVTAFTRVSVEKHGHAPTQAFERGVQRIPEVLECYSLTGEADYLLRVVAPDLTGYSDVLTGKVLPLPGVTSVNSALVLREIKHTTTLPLQYARRG